MARAGKSDNSTKPALATKHEPTPPSMVIAPAREPNSSVNTAPSTVPFQSLSKTTTTISNDNIEKSLRHSPKIKPPSRPIKKKGTRRGGKKKLKKKNVYSKEKFNVLLTNLQSSSNKINSLQSIVNSLDIHLLIANETHLKKYDKFNLEGFKCFTRNRQDAAMGGIATCIVKEQSVNTVKVAEGKSEEFIITRHNEFKPALNVINYYGKQESRQTTEEVERGWEEVLDEIIKI